MDFRHRLLGLALVLALAFVAPTTAFAGKIFITGHDPDYHAQGSAGAKELLETGLNYVTNGTWNTGSKFLWVESFLPATGGHLVGEHALTGALGLVQGTNFDWVDGAGFSSVNLSNY